MTARDIPEPIKRTVRKKSGFGCVICGLPIYHYDHIEDFAAVDQHDPNNITLLCPNHHQDKTSNRLSKNLIRNAADSPINLNASRTSSHKLWMIGDKARLEIGGNIYEFSFAQLGGYFSAIKIQDTTVVGMGCEDGSLLLDITLTDRAGAIVFQVKRGEMSVSTGVWDYQYEGPRIVIHSAERNITLDMSILDDGVAIRRGGFFLFAIGLVVEPDHHTILPNNIRMSGNRIVNCRCGLVVGNASGTSAAIRLT